MKPRGVLQATQLSAAHALLFAFTVLLVRKLDHVFVGAWWRVFTPLWLFHAVVARWRFSLPAPSDVHDCRRPPTHAFASLQLLLAFEVLLCLYLDTSAVNLKLVFLPVVLLEIIIIVDNVRMYFSLMPEERDDSSINVTQKKTTHCLIILSMTFILGATIFMVLIITGDAATGNWWGAYFVFSVGQCFAFLVCTRWTYPIIIDRYSQTQGLSLSSGTTDHLNETTCLLVKVEEDQKLDKMFSLQNIGGHFMKVPLIVFQVLLCMHLQGTPAGAREIPFQIIFSPLLLLQAAGALFSILQLLEGIGILHLIIEAGSERYFMISRAYDFLEFILHGSRFLGWWSIDGQEAEERLNNYRSGIHPDVLEKMSKRDLVEDVWALQVALRKQIKTTKSSEEKCARLQKEKVICKICKEMEIDVVALPCGHWVLCRFCFRNCPLCPACKASIRSGLIVHNM